MSSVTCDIAMSVDGFVAGPKQSLGKPLRRGSRGSKQHPREATDASRLRLTSLPEMNPPIRTRARS
jgi:hypothetical protein